MHRNARVWENEFALSYFVISLKYFQINHKFERLEGHPGETVVKAAHDHNADFVIVGSRGHGVIRRTILGSISGYILHHSDVPVLICKHEDEKHRLRHKSGEKH